MLRPKPPPAGQAEPGLGTETLRFRDPLTVALSTDGRNFSRVVSVMSCTNLSVTSGCSPRLPGSGKNAGPSYPQGLALGEADVAGTVRTTAALGIRSCMFASLMTVAGCAERGACWAGRGGGAVCRRVSLRSPLLTPKPASQHSAP